MSSVAGRLLSAVLMVTCFEGSSEPLHVVREGGIASVVCGDPEEKVFSTFVSEYKLEEIPVSRSQKRIRMYTDDNLVVAFHMGMVRNKWIVGMIDVYDRWRTPEGVGVGSSLDEAIGLYGRPAFDPTDEGYYVFFKSTEGMKFLLHNEDIPAELRRIPDDVFLEQHEKRILELSKNIAITRIRVYRTGSQYD